LRHTIAPAIVSKLMQLRPANETDFEQICRLFTSEEELFWIYPCGRYPFTIDQLQHLSEIRRDLTVAEAQGVIVGFANLYDFAPAQHAFIGNVVVQTRFRGTGVGRSLVGHMLDLTREKYALPEARISVLSHNVKAVLLYSGFGFTPYQVEERRDFSGNRVALLHMKLCHQVAESI
jgi:ribosomal protein S18 acetylase RimI-like enzyme